MILCLALLLSVAGLRAQVPFFTLTPSNRVVAATYDVTFPLAAEGASPLTYQWFFNGSPLADATNDFLTLTTVSNDSAGAYHAIVTNDFGSITSAPVTLTVVAPLTAATFAGSVSAPGVTDGQGPDARFYLPSGIALDEAGTLYVAEAYGLVIRAISPGGHVRTLAGLAEVSGTNDGVGTNALFAEPQGLVMTRAGHLFVADAGSHTIRKVTRDGTVTTFAGQAGSVGADDGPGPDARFYLPQGLAVDTNDNLYVADRNNGAIRKITPEGVVSTVTNDTSFAEALAFDDAGNLYFSYYWSTVMKRAQDGTTTLLAGEPSVYGEADGLGADARFTHVRGLVWHRDGYLLVADGHRVRRISTNGLVTTLAGSTPNNFQDGTGFGAGFHIQGATALDASGHLYTSDSYNHTIRKLGFGVVLVWEQDDVAVALGSNVTLSVTATSDVPVSYQWRFHGTPLPGATNATLELTNVSFATAGNYTVIVSNELRAVASRVARVVIPTLLLAQQGRGTITAAPVQATYAPGEDVLLTAVPARYHEFVGWSDGVTTPDRIITVGLENSFTAIFTNTLPLEALSFSRDWTHGGAQADRLYSLLPAADGGFLLGGYSASGMTGNKTTEAFAAGVADYWLIKTDSHGDKQWERVFGGTGDDYLLHIHPANDGGHLLAGYSWAIGGGNKTNAGFGHPDYWLVKVDENGSNQWQKVYGGSTWDEITRVEDTADGGYLLIGNSYPGSGGNKTSTNFGSFDFWVVKINSTGEKVWERIYGGSNDDGVYSSARTLDGGFVFAGRSFSASSGNKAAPAFGDYDGWLVKVDANGNKLWDRSYGGSGYDEINEVVATPDGGFLLNLVSNSGLEGNKGVTNFGGYDCWLVKVDANGDKQWERILGGSGDENLAAMRAAQDGGFFLAGGSSSGVSGDRTTGSFGAVDLWVVKVNALGEKEWDAAFGGGQNDSATFMHELADGSLLLGGESSSPTGGTKTTPHYGLGDMWLVHYARLEAPAGTPVILLNGQPANYRTNILNSQTPVTITLTSTWNGPIHFTLDGSEPDFNSALYDPQNPPQVVPPATVKAIAYTNDLYLASELYVNFSEVVSTHLEYVPLYTASVSTPGGGVVAVSPAAASYASNTVITISATNLPGWTFLGWQGDVTSTNPVEVVTLNSNFTAQAIFGTALTTNMTGLGSIARTPALALYPYGSTVRLTALPGASRYLSLWGGALFGSISPQDLVMTNATPTVSATFGTITGTNFGLTVQIAGEGTVSYTPATNRFGSNSVVTLTATPQPGWVFVNWSGGSNSTANPLALIMHTNKTVTAVFDPVCLAPPPGLVAWWRGESNAVDSVGGNSGTLSNGATFAAGRVGTAFSFDGVDDNFAAADAPAFQLTNGFTFVGWLRPANGTNTPFIFTKYNTLENQASWALSHRPGGEVVLNMYQSVVPIVYRAAVTTNAGVTNGAWVHLAATFDLASQEIAIYVNGTRATVMLEAGSSALSSIMNSTAPVRIGTGQGGIGPLHTPMYGGLMDDVAVFNRALTSNEIAAIHAASGSGMCPPAGATNLPPVVALTNPAPGAIFTAPASIALAASASDNDGTVASVKFYDGAALIADMTSGPFTFIWTNAALGAHTLRAVATDNGGLSATSSPVSITVTTAVPEIVLNSPTNGNVFLAPANVLVSALVSDADNSVGYVSFYDGTNWLGSVTNPPFRLTWTNTPLGAHSFYAVAHDLFGPVVTSSPPANVTVTSTATNPPVFSWSNAVVSVGEAGGAVTLHVLKSADSAQVPADIGFHPQSASADTADFTPPGFSLLSFGVGETVKPITIPITQDSLVESNHFFLMVLDLITGSISGPAEAQITIVDDDIPGTNSFLTRVAPGALPSPLATLRVDLSPTNVGQWRFVWENAWHDGGSQISGLPPGNYELQFKPVSGYVEPLATYVAVITNTLNQYSFTYSNTAAPQLGSLVVNINPAFVATNGNPNERGQWRRVGEGAWRDSGTTADALPAGTHVIEFKLLTAGSWQTPSAQEVTVLPNQLNVALGEYFVANPTPGTPPTALNFSSQVQNPFGFQRGYQFVGQLLTPLGWGSGTVVKQRVVLTAAHVVFNDYALAFVPNDAVKWFFQRQAGEYEPAPQSPRGFVVSSGYAAQRQAEASPGISGTASRDLDIAAIYFGESAGRGGFSGYLVTRPGQEYLQLATSASLAGYPVEGIPAQDRGKMHRTEERGVSWSVVSNQVYATTDLKSYPGNSGGPILVQLATNVNYWPAAVYLGGSGNTIVRAIDDLAVGLINTAEALGNAGGNNTGGEPPRRATDCPTCSPLIYGVLEVSLTPTNIGTLGGGYRFKNATNGVIYREPFNRFFVLGNVPWTLEFLPSPYTIAPTNRTITTTAGHTNRTTGLYRQWGQLGFSDGQLRMFGSSGAVYRIDFKPTLTTNVWTPVKTQTLSGAGVTLTNLVPGASNGFFRAVLLP